MAELRGLAPHPALRDRSLSRRRRHAGPVETPENEVVAAEGLISLRFDPCGLPAAILQPLRGEWHLHPQLIDFKSIASSIGPRGHRCEMVRTAGFAPATSGV